MLENVTTQAFPSSEAVNKAVQGRAEPQAVLLTDPLSLQRRREPDTSVGILSSKGEAAPPSGKSTALHQGQSASKTQSYH